MKKEWLVKSLVLVIVTLFVSGGVVSAFSMNNKPESLNNGNWLYVGGSGEDNYTRIRDAINDAVDGDTVFVYDDSSPYYENVIVNKSINLLGENKYTTVINGSRHGFRVTTHDVNISGFNISNSSEGGIIIESNNNKISGNIFTNDGIGIYLSGNHNILTENIIEHNGAGIETYGSNYNTMFKNTIFNSRIGFFIQGAHFNNIFQNSAKDCLDEGILLSSSGFNKIFLNSFENCSLGFSLQYQGFFNIIKENNFIKNYDGNAEFYLSYGDRWIRNYWDDYNGIGFYKIKGAILVPIFIFPFLNQIRARNP